ncbi:MAG: D-glycero-beta-D-manno-heptose-7-phosphate kinase [FCB group bacterium]|nr:D-glycero-beta-D-manno-heptose-7-phosphate kinase [FCB group bacterium]
MVDRYFWGEIERISPEAPVPVVEVREENYNLGGAANVVNNLAALGTQPVPFGVIGDDEAGRTLKDILREQSLDSACVFVSKDRPTTIKTRVIARNQHVVRVDRESRQDLPREIEDAIIAKFREMASTFDAAIFQDYNKGVITERIIREITKIANENGVTISTDPKFHNFFAYQGVTVFKPNIKETEAALVTKIETDDDLIDCGRKIFELIAPKHLLITRGSKGMTLFLDRENTVHLPTKALKVHDVSGAGDTVIATLTAFLAAGASLEEAAIIANYAAGEVCEEVGVVTISSGRLRDILLEKD